MEELPAAALALLLLASPALAQRGPEAARAGAPLAVEDFLYSREILWSTPGQVA